MKLRRLHSGGSYIGRSSLVVRMICGMIYGMNTASCQLHREVKNLVREKKLAVWNEIVKK